MPGIVVPLATVLLMAGACVGLGAALLTVLGLCTRLTRSEAAVWGFVAGFGILGWLMFFLGTLGFIGSPVLLCVLVAGLAGSVLLRNAPADAGMSGRGDIVWFVLLAGLAFVVAVDLAEAFSPPADADSLAYHFALPKQFLAAGHVFFVPRAVDGAIPLLAQMTYMVALALGGETAMTLWAGLSGWMLGLLTFVAARPHTGRNWAACAALLVCSTPVVLYSAGTGQVEVRLALFTTLAALAMIRAIAERSLAFIVLSGLAAGFCMATKFTGTVAAAACILPLLVWWRSPKAVVVFALTAAAMGAQWYIWNWWHTGDPLFPALYTFLGLPDSGIWTAEQDAVFKEVYFAVERPLPRTIMWLLGYPLWATLVPSVAIESGRTGFGPYGLVVLPFAVAALWRWRDRVLRHPLTILALIALAFYVLWFVSGMSQRVRHLLPIWPIAVICLTAVLARWSRIAGLHRPLVCAVGVVALIQLGGQAFFGLSYFQHLVSGESREDFLRRSVSYYDYVAPSQAQMILPSDRIFVGQRYLIYFFDRPVFYFHDLDQSQVVIRHAASDPASLLRDLRAQGITLVLVPSPVGIDDAPGPLPLGMDALVHKGCASIVSSFTANGISSRTLRTPPVPVPAALYRLTEQGCVIS